MTDPSPRAFVEPGFLIGPISSSKPAVEAVRLTDLLAFAVGRRSKDCEGRATMSNRLR